MAFKQLIPAAGAPSLADSACANGGDPRQAFWDVIASLKTAKAAFGLKDRHFALLQALVSFVRERKTSGAWVVFASNEKLCERANEMGERTMRRHIARLVEAGLLRRAQSPNGKRYVHRRRDGSILQAYGFDLGPLLERAGEIAQRAAEAEEEKLRIRLLRDRLSVLRREWPVGSEEDDAIRLALRRRLSSVELETLVAQFTRAEEAPLPCPETSGSMDPGPLESENLSADDGQIDRHHQRSTQKKIESEKRAPADQASRPTRPAEKNEPSDGGLHLADVVAACPEAVSFSQEPLRSWLDLHALARFLAPMLGLRGDVLAGAEREMGQGGLTLTLLAMTQMHAGIRSPGAYLRTLTRDSASGKFDPVHLIRSLARRSAAEPTPAGLPG